MKPTDDIDLVPTMTELADKRRSHWTYQLCSPNEMPRLPFPADRLLLGTYSACHCRALIRCINYPFTALLYPSGRETISSIARDYLCAKYPKRNRILFAQAQALHYMPVPLMSVPTYPEENFDGAYIDLKRAYWQITRTVGWNVDFYPGHWIGVKSDNEDYPLAENKLATNILVASCLPSTMRLMDDKGRVASKTTFNRNLNMQLHMLTMLMLHAVAQIANSWGAIYVNTDGAIVPTEYAGDCIQEIWHKCGLLSRVKKHGYCVVKAIGAYQIDNEQTLRFDQTTHYHRHRNLYPDDELLVWTRNKFAVLAKRRNPYIQSNYHEPMTGLDIVTGKVRKANRRKEKQIARIDAKRHQPVAPIHLPGKEEK